MTNTPNTNIIYNSGNAQYTIYLPIYFVLSDRLDECNQHTNEVFDDYLQYNMIVDHGVY